MKQNLILVGGGVIARHYQNGLAKSETLQLSALVDVNPECTARNCYSVPFFTNLQDALTPKPQIALLALPAAVRRKTACELLSQGIAVLTEKPMCESLEEMQALFACSEQCNTPIACIFHWKAADEVRYLKAHLKEFGAVSAVKTTVCDDYAATPDGSIRVDRRGLLGAWIDSGINVLSFYDELLDLSDAKLEAETLLPDSVSGLNKFACKRFDFGGVKAEITVDWTKPSRDKFSEITCDSGTLFINHSSQTVSLNGKTIFSCPTEDRLSSHYINLFSRLTLDTASEEQTLMLHKILYTGNAR